MDDGTPTLEVGFAIESEGSFGTLKTLDDLIGKTSADAVRDFQRMEAASRGSINLAGATAQVTSFGAASTREMANTARETARAEKAGEAMVRQLQRQAETFGMTTAQARAFRAEQRALAAESNGLTELAGRIRAVSAEMDRVERQRSLVSAGFGSISTTGRLAGHQLTNVAFQAQDLGIQLAMAAGSSAPLRMSLMALAQQGSQVSGIMMQSGMSAGQFGKQLLVAAKLITVSSDALLASTAAGLSAQSRAAAAEVARTEAALAAANAEMFLARSSYAAAAGTDAEAAALLRLAAARTAQSAASGEAAVAAVGLKAANQAAAAAASDLAAAETVALAPLGTALAAIAVVAGVAAIGIAGLQKEANDGASMKEYAKSLGLTAKEIRNLDDVTVTFGDTAKAVFQVAGRAIWGQIGPAVTTVWETMKSWTAWIFSGVKAAANFMIGAFVGGYRAIVATWGLFPAALGDLFMQAVNKAIDGVNWLIQKSVAGINWMTRQANKILPAFAQIGQISAGTIGAVENQWAGSAAKVGEVWRKEVGSALGTDYLGKAGKAFAGAVVDQATRNARERIKKEAEKKGYLDPEKGKTDKHAEQLAREAEAVEAQIKNLYALADAYKVSGAAALIAEARVKAESDAIKKRGDIEEFVDRQIRLAIAQRVSDAAKSTATMREQSDAIEQVNAAVRAGLVPTERAAELVKDQIADLPLLAAIQAAQQRGLTDEVKRATDALAEQRKERERLRVAEEQQRFNADIKTGSNRLAELREELRLVGATDEVRVHALAVLKATQEAESKFTDPTKRASYIAQQVEIADTAERLAAAQRNYNDALGWAAEKWDLIAQNVQDAAGGMADAFGNVGRAIGDMAAIYASYQARRARLDKQHIDDLKKAGSSQAQIERANARFALASATSQIGAFGDMTAAAKGFFDEKSKGYQALATAEKVFRAIEFALSVKAMAQDVIETGASIAKSAARAAAHGVEAVAKAIASLPFPLNLVAGAATAAAIAALGISIVSSFGGGGGRAAPTNTGTGTVLGDASAKSESIKNAIDALKEVDTLTNNYARQMAASLRTIESSIGGLASLLVRNGEINANGGVTQGFRPNAIGSVLGALPLIGGLLRGLFGTTTTVTGSGLYGGPQSVGNILSGGFDASYYSDIQRRNRFLGITTSTRTSTQYTGADAGLEQQFTLLLRQFNAAILEAAGPLGEATDAIQSRLNGFVVNLGRIDLQGLSGEQIQERLTAVFGAAADGMADAAFPGIARFQQVGEGAFETLVRVASTIEAVTNALGTLGAGAQQLGIDAKLGLAGQFDSIGDFTGAVEAYFQAFYTQEEQTAARTAQLTSVFQSLGLVMPASLAAFRQLVEAQDLTSAAGQATYATLLQLAPAFAELQEAMAGAKSAADIASERQDLQRQLLELRGNTAALRALELARLDASNRALQQEIWAIEDAQAAAKAADDLRQAWVSVGDSIVEEVNRIRGLSGADGSGGFATMLGRFNAASDAARAGDIDAAKSLPGLSQALLTAAAAVATSRQELARVQAQTAASLEATNAAINGRTGLAALLPSSSPQSSLEAAAATQAASAVAASNDDLATEVRLLREEVSQLRSDNNAGHAATAGNTGAIKRKLEDVTAASGGDAISTVQAA